jgi:hypothetical protein
MSVWSVHLRGRRGAVRQPTPSRDDAPPLERDQHELAEAPAREAAALALHARRLEDALGGAGCVSYY